MLSGDIPEGFKNRTSINENIFVSNNCFNIDLTGAIGNWVDSNAVERPFS
ncbi:MAG: hypothetical protein LBD11_00590 [Candidatus Peribacteria bacterium]|jgi:hypothetical protein|nr:hypothetical protein [Candidatus Peribacteria bacterium]